MPSIQVESTIAVYQLSKGFESCETDEAYNLAKKELSEEIFSLGGDKLLKPLRFTSIEFEQCDSTYPEHAEATYWITITADNQTVIDELNDLFPNAK